MSFIKINPSTVNKLSLILLLVGIHSFVVGLLLIIRPDNVFSFFGFNMVNEPFFPFQGGIFHIIMSIGYILGALNPDRFSGLIIFSIIVKISAAVLLTFYFFITGSALIILLSGIADGLMGLFIYLIYKHERF